MKRYLPLILTVSVIVLASLPGFALLPTGMKNWTATQTLKATDLNSNFNKLTTILNGNVEADNFSADFQVPASWVQDLPVHGIHHLTGGGDPLDYGDSVFYVLWGGQFTALKTGDFVATGGALFTSGVGMGGGLVITGTSPVNISPDMTVGTLTANRLVSTTFSTIVASSSVDNSIYGTFYGYASSPLVYCNILQASGFVGTPYVAATKVECNYLKVVASATINAAAMTNSVMTNCALNNSTLLLASGSASFLDITTATGTAIASICASIEAARVAQALPVGTIVMWASSTIPTGWAICDGTAGTPDLTDRFIMGAGDSYPANATGGSFINSHTASASVVANSHTHGVTGTTDATPAGSVNENGGSSTNRADISHVHAFTTTSGDTSVATHTHDIVIESQTVIPRYYALYYIMKVL